MTKQEHQDYEIITPQKNNDAPDEPMALQTVDQVNTLVNNTYKGAIVLIIILSGIYAFSPIDTLPDIIPVAGQIDDVVVIASGFGAIGFISALRPIFLAIMKRPLLRAGCLVALAGTTIVMVGGALLAFYGIYQLISAL